MKTHSKYECERCGAFYATPDAALKCEAIPMDDIDLEPGDIISGGPAYGWWKGDFDWFHEQPGDPKSRSHLDRAQKGFPKFVVIKIVPMREVSSIGGAYAHKMAAIVYSPAHANYKGNRVVGYLSRFNAKHGKVSAEDLARYIADAEKLGHPGSL